MLSHSTSLLPEGFAIYSLLLLTFVDIPTMRHSFRLYIIMAPPLPFSLNSSWANANLSSQLLNIIEFNGIAANISETVESFSDTPMLSIFSSVKICRSECLAFSYFCTMAIYTVQNPVSKSASVIILPVRSPLLFKTQEVATLPSFFTNMP